MDNHRVLRYATVHLALSLIVSLYSIEGRLKDLSIEANVEPDGQLDSIQRNAVKTIKTKYGDEYDCLELYKQPALDHILLKNHKLQMRPSFDPQRDVANPSGRGSSSGTSMDVVLTNSCPLGTVPFRRRSRAELLRSKTIFREQHMSTRNNPRGFAFAGIGTAKKEGTVYHGAGGMISINNPSVNNGQFSASVISIEGGPADEFSVIRVGWMVNVDLHRDNKTRLYTLWGQGKNGVMHGCYNTYCPGFVQTDASIALDMVLEPISVVRGPQYYVKLAINQDKYTGNWWLIYGENNTPVGYWPSSLFSNLGNGAAALRWGGMVYASAGQMPPMGNGDNGDIHSSHFRQVVLKYESGTPLNGPIDVPLEVFQNRCYKCGDNSYKGDYWGYSFYFGGNGGDITQCS